MSYLIKLLLNKRRKQGEEESQIQFEVSSAAVKIAAILAAFAFVLLGAEMHDVLNWLSGLVR